MVEERIITPGVYEDIPFKEYLGIDVISKSTLFNVATSEFYYKYMKDEKAKEDVAAPEATHFVLGRATHTACLEPEKFDAQYCIAPVINKRTNQGKADWAKFVANCIETGVNPLSSEQYDQVRGMGEAVVNHPAAQDILCEGVAETTMIDFDEDFDLPRKCRTDWIVEDHIIDLKSTGRGAGEHQMLMQILELGYYMQAGMYKDISLSLLPQKPRSFSFIFVESKKPHQVGIYYCDEKMMDLGLRMYKALMTKLLRAQSSDVWPHYNDNRIVKASFYPWQVAKIEKEIAAILEK